MPMSRAAGWPQDSRTLAATRDLSPQQQISCVTNMQAIILLIDHEDWLKPLGVGGPWALPLGQQLAVELTLRWLERSAINEVLSAAP